MKPTGPEGFEQFVAARGPGLLRLGYLLSGDRDLAEDLVQETLAKAYAKWDRVHSADNLKAYVDRMLINEFVGWWRRRHYREVSGPLLHGMLADAADAHAERDLIWRSLGRLPARQRAVLVLRYYEDATDADIAAALGCATGTVRSLASRAFTALRNDVDVRATTAPSETARPREA